MRVPTGAGGATRLGEFVEEGARRGLSAPARTRRVDRGWALALALVLAGCGAKPAATPTAAPTASPRARAALPPALCRGPVKERIVGGSNAPAATELSGLVLSPSGDAVDAQ